MAERIAASRRRLSAAEWAEIPFIPGTTPLCSVTVDGKKCNGPHRHAKCALLPAAKAEKARMCSEKAAALTRLRSQQTADGWVAMLNRSEEYKLGAGPTGVRFLKQ